MPIDILIYAVIAAVMVLWLRSVLGTRHGEERQRPNPFEDKPDDSVSKTRNEDGDSMPPIDMDPSATAPATEPVRTGDEKIDSGLVKIALADRSFDLKAFKDNAEDAFTFIVTAFAEGDRDTLRDLCTHEVYDAFDAAITEREKAGETVTTEIHAIRKVEVTEAGMDGHHAFVTLRIIADETYVIRDSKGGIVAGDPDRVTDMTDKWTFSRNTKSRDPRWFLSKTEDDIPEDNGKTPLPEAG